MPAHKKPRGSRRRALSLFLFLSLFLLLLLSLLSLLSRPSFYAVTGSLESTFTGVSQPNLSGFSPFAIP